MQRRNEGFYSESSGSFSSSSSKLLHDLADEFVFDSTPSHSFEDEDEDEDDWRLAPPSRRADQDTRQKHQNATENDLENGR